MDAIDNRHPPIGSTHFQLFRRSDFLLRRRSRPPATSYRPGSDVSYKVTVTNNGPASAPDVEVFNTAPAGLSFKSTEGDCPTSSPCTLGEISPRANKSF